MRKILINVVMFSFILLPLILWLSWIAKPSHKTNVMILDKTVLTNYGLEHQSFNWVLAHRKYTRQDGKSYNAVTDYLGFFPLQNDLFRINDLSKYTENQIDSLAEVTDMTYFTDTYGMYENEWYKKRNQSEHSRKIYGGMAKNDVLFLKKMKEKKKLIMAEFNFFATPTPIAVRVEAENVLGLKWSGWTGRYFEQLDTIKNPELPPWVIRLYKDQHKGQWPFSKPGIVFVHSDETIAILEKETDLKYEVPLVKSFDYGVNKFNLPKEIRYPYWFDITLSADTNSRVISYYEVMANSRGDSILHHHNIPKIFPASIENLKDSPFYYFCGDFTDSPIEKAFVQLPGIQYFKMFVLNEADYNDRTPFFWRYYFPLTSKILNDYYKGKTVSASH